MDIQTLIEKRANRWQEAKTFLNERTGADGKISAEDAATYERMESEIADLSKNIERFERQAAMDLKMAAPTSQPILNNPKTSAMKTGRASDEYKQATLIALRSNLKQVSNLLQESVAADGGYLVPAEWDSRLIQALEEENVMRQLGTVITTSGEHKINILATQPTAYWVAEGGSITPSSATYGQKVLDAHKVAAEVIVTNELLSDNAYDIETQIIDQSARALANAEEDAFLNGAESDTGKPTGLLTTATADSTTVKTTTGNSIATDDVIDLVYALKRPYRKNAAFLLNDATLAIIRKLKDANQAYIWQPSYQAGEPDRLLGYPVYTSAYFPTVEAGKPAVAFGDFSYYNIGDRGTRSFQELRELHAPQWSTGFLMVERVDGVLTLPEAVRVLKIK